MEIGDRIKALRKAVNLTQEEFASRLKISKGFVSNLEKGRVLPSEQLIHLMAYEFSSSEYWLTTGEDSMFLPPVEVVRQQISRLGERAYYDALKQLLDDNGLIVLRSALGGRGNEKEFDPELEPMIHFLVDLWSVGDEKLKAWATVQFSRAFPDDVKEEVQKKRAKDQGRESIA